MSKFVIKRTRLAWFADEYVNLYDDGTIIFRSVHMFEPEKDTKKVIKSKSLVYKVSKIFKDEESTSYHAENVCDGVMYEVLYYGKNWTLFCPEYSEDKSIVMLGEKIEETIENICNQELD